MHNMIAFVAGVVVVMMLVPKHFVCVSQSLHVTSCIEVPAHGIAPPCKPVQVDTYVLHSSLQNQKAYRVLATANLAGVTVKSADQVCSVGWCRRPEARESTQSRVVVCAEWLFRQ